MNDLRRYNQRRCIDDTHQRSAQIGRYRIGHHDVVDRHIAFILYQQLEINQHITRIGTLIVRSYRQDLLRDIDVNQVERCRIVTIPTTVGS